MGSDAILLTFVGIGVIGLAIVIRLMMRGQAWEEFDPRRADHRAVVIAGGVAGLLIGIAIILCVDHYTSTSPNPSKPERVSNGV